MNFALEKFLFILLVSSASVALEFPENAAGLHDSINLHDLRLINEAISADAGLARYEIVDFLGSGIHGIVFKAIGREESGRNLDHAVVDNRVTHAASLLKNNFLKQKKKNPSSMISGKPNYVAIKLFED